MPRWFLVFWIVLALVALAARWLTRGRLRRTVGADGWLDVVLVAVGSLGLVFHCGAMFYHSTFGSIPGLGGAADTVNALQGPSMALYSVPAFLLVVGLRRTPWPYLALVAAALIAVGITMYDGGPLNAHLTAIFVAVVLLAVGVPLLLARPGARGHTSARASSPTSVTV